MVEISPSTRSDLEAFYRISLQTGDCGRDASVLYKDPKLMGHIYSAPYLLHAPEFCLTAVQNGMVAGFCIGTADTTDFFEELECDWWPALRRHYPMPDPARSENWTVDERRIAAIHHPKHPPSQIAKRYPAHLHMNLLPHCQGRGVGGRLLQAWLRLVRAEGITAIHLGANPGNARAIAFWLAQGFEHLPIEGDHRTYWMVQDLPGG